MEEIFKILKSEIPKRINTALQEWVDICLFNKPEPGSIMDNSSRKKAPSSPRWRVVGKCIIRL